MGYVSLPQRIFRIVPIQEEVCEKGRGCVPTKPVTAVPTVAAAMSVPVRIDRAMTKLCLALQKVKAVAWFDAQESLKVW